MTTKTKFNTTNNDAGQLASIEGHKVLTSFPSYPCGPLSFFEQRGSHRGHGDISKSDDRLVKLTGYALTTKTATPNRRFNGKATDGARFRSCYGASYFFLPVVHSINFTLEIPCKHKGANHA